jgi:exodeoxyribonuclease VII large subunit
VSARRQAASPAGELPEVWSVGELTRRLAGLVAGLGRVSVEGEVSRVSRAASGHVYFDLKDVDAKLACKLWRSQVARALKGELREGDRVVVHGRLDVYPPQGSYSLVVDRVEAAGLGALLARLEALKAQLRERGWFDRKRPLPAWPQTIGVVTSRDGAALQDFLRTRTQRWPLYPLRLAHTPVQGPGAAEQVAAAVRRLDASGVDVIVVCRGGGSLEDLWCFNELAVAEAVWDARVPVVSGVGHETDTTLCDLVADHRAHTPTDAAQTVIPDRAALLAALERAAGHLAQAVDDVLEQRTERLARAGAARALRDPSRLVRDREALLQRAHVDLRRAARARVEAAGTRAGELLRRLERVSPRRQLEARATRLQAAGLRAGARLERMLGTSQERERSLARQLEALSPLAVLARGYSITTRAVDGRPLTDACDLREGEELSTRLARGRLLSRVTRVEPPPGPEPTRP